MFEQILELVKEHMGNNPNVSIPADQADAVHHEIATHITNGLENTPAAPAETSSGMGGILSQLESSFTSGGLATSAISGGLVGSLASKFGLPPVITGAIAAALPSLIQKFAQKNSTAGAEPAAV